MRLTHRQKKILVSTVTPVLALLYWSYKLVSLEAFRRHSLTELRQNTFGEFPKRILVVRLDTIGDVILSEPAIRALRQALPEAQVDAVVGPAGRAVLSGNPCIDRFIVYDAPWHAAWRGRRIDRRGEIIKALSMARELRRNRYDLALELRGDLRDIAFMAATGAKVKVGNGWRGGSFMLDIDAAIDVEAHRVEFAMGIVNAVGASAQPSSPKVWFGEPERETAEKYLPESASTRYVAMHLGAGFPSKCLPVEKFASVAGAIANPANGEKRRVVVIGGKDDELLAGRFKELFAGEPVDLVGRLNLTETAAVLQRCALFVGNDSGPMHLAAAVGTPIVTFFGPSEPHKYRPYMVSHKLIELDLPCRPCDHIHCSQTEYLCMTRIQVANIVLAAEELLSSGRVVGESTV